MLVKVLVWRAGAERMHADEQAVAADNCIPPLPDCSLDADLDSGFADQAAAIGLVLLEEKLKARHRYDAGADALLGQQLGAIDRNLDLRAGREDRHVRVAF